MRWNEHVNLKGFLVAIVSSTCFLFFTCNTVKKASLVQANNNNTHKVALSYIEEFQDTQDIQQRKLKRECKSVDNFYYDSKYPFLHQKKRIRVNFHFINSIDSSHNFNPDKGVKFAKELIYYANGKLRDNVAMNLPEGNNTPVDPVPFRYRLTPNPDIPGDDGIYFHYVDEPFFVNHGKNANNYDRKLINELAINKDTILNIFYMVHHPDSAKIKTYRAKPAGIALGHTVKLGVNGSKKVNPWTHAGLLNHEIGHVLSLSHAWIKNDGCDDTPKHPNCWNKGPDPCDGAVSNNVMDYNSIQMAYSPCQIAKTYQLMMNEKSSKRDLVIKEWCSFDKSKTVMIKDTQSWSRPVDIYGDIIIEPNGYLISNCSINMPHNSKIEVKGGGTLLLNNATIKNDCGKTWEGIFFNNSNGKTANVSYIDTFYLENIEKNPLTNI